MSRHWHDQLLDAVGQAVVATGLDGRITYWNAAAERLYGWSVAEALGRPALELVAMPEWAAAGADGLDRVAAGTSWRGEVSQRHRAGGAFLAEVTATPVRDAGGAIVGMVGVIVDVTARREEQDAVRAAEARHRARFEQTNVPQILADLDGRLTAANPAFCRLVGRDEAAVVGGTIGALTHPGDRRETTERIQELRAGEVDTVQAEKRFLHADGRIVPVLLSASVIRDGSGAPTSYAGFMQDLSEVKRAEEELAHAALHDALTGLPNRALLLDRLDHALARRARECASVALLLVDLDDFTTVNDSLGHLVGDEMLRVVAGRLRAFARAGDTVARFGGDQLAVLCEDVGSPAAVQTLAERLAGALASVIPLESGAEVFVTASIGVALSPAPDAATLLGAADAALSRAKHRGRGRVVVFDEALREAASDRLRLATELRQAVARDELVLHYQPVLELRQGRVVGLEALVRWAHPVRGLLSPDAFVPVAEDTGLIVELGGWVLGEACRTIAELTAAGHPVRVSVNLSARQLARPDVVDVVADALADSGADPSGLLLEVTESAVMEDGDGALERLGALKQLGVQLSIDDFGTGYSSLVYLKHFPVDELKVDRAFVAGLGRDPDDSAIVASVISLAKAVGVRAVAEGVETAQQLAVLRTLGCDLGQGFLWSPGVPAAELPAALARLAGERMAAIPLAPPPAPAVVDEQADDPQAEETEERIVLLHRDGASLHTIAAALNAEGRRTRRGTRWRAASVARVVAGREYPAIALIPPA